MRRFVKIGMFLGSYSPLFILLALLNWQNELIGSFDIRGLVINWLPISFLALSVIGVLIIMTFLRIAKTMSPSNVMVSIIEIKNQETLAYLVTYLIPFIGFTFKDGFATVANVIIFIMIGFLYVQSNMIHLNPVLSIMGYKVFKVAVGGSEKLVLAKRDIKDQTKLKVITVSEGIYIDAR